MKLIMTIALALTAPAVIAQPVAKDPFFAFTDTLERVCNREFVTVEQARACKTGGTLVFGAPRTQAMEDYLVLLDQCTATYQDASSQFAPAIPFSELRAACQTGLVWARSYLASAKAG